MRTEDISLTVIGSGDAFNSGGRRQTCFHVESPKITFLIDCGVNTLQGLKSNRLSVNEIDLVLISHLHGDHFGGLPFFLLEAAVAKRKKSLSIVAPAGCKQKLEKLSSLLYPGTEILSKLDLHFHEYASDQPFMVRGLEVIALPVIHKLETKPHGVKIKIDDKIISYSGDTEWTTTLVDLAKNANLFICECNFYKKEIRGHLSYETLSKHLKEFQCKQILLTHLGDDMLKRVDQIKLTYATDDLKISI